MIINTLVVTDYQQNARLLIDDASMAVCVVDPGGDIDALMGRLEGKPYTIESIFLTHCHIDHAGGVQALLAWCDTHGYAKPTLYYHHLDIPVAQWIEPYAMMNGLSPQVYRNAPEPDVDLDGVEVFRVGQIEGKVFFTPGHAPGHVVLFFEQAGITLQGHYEEPVNNRPVLIAGDTLFKQSIGRTDLPGGDHDTLLASIRRVHMSLPDDTLVLPGHGPNTTIGAERVGNPFLL